MTTKPIEDATADAKSKSFNELIRDLKRQDNFGWQDNQFFADTQELIHRLELLREYLKVDS